MRQKVYLISVEVFSAIDSLIVPVLVFSVVKMELKELGNCRHGIIAGQLLCGRAWALLLYSYMPHGQWFF